ncbi:Na(+)/H(+) antiporter subunit B [Corynebacterium lowii]|uniref:Na(+)/H(+) antiporter subunit B n=3 Tax=Corynebacterium lowii TaxID=1544413 RepID=A0A0Q0YHQ4_9CORY|nr:Na(+)/H(+) antiporter subunit B [Corynebacterium lowii]
MFLGRPPLTTEVWDLHVPLVGEMHLPSALLFDAGVYLIVIGLIMHILTSLGGQIDQDEAARRQRARDRARSMARRKPAAAASATGKENR